MAETIIPLRVSAEQIEKLREIAEWNCTELCETLHDMIDSCYKQHCECVAKFIEECGDNSSGPDADDYIPF